MADLTVLCLLVVASLVNGITNPLMKKHSVGIENVKAGSAIGQVNLHTHNIYNTYIVMPMNQ
jgi:hypothetical protein